MGSTLCCPEHNNSKQSQKKEEISLLEQFMKLEKSSTSIRSRESGRKEKRFGLPSSFTQFIKPSCLHVAKQQESKEERLLEKSDDNVSGLLTLEEWILASPCLNRGVSAKKVYPTISDENRESSLVEKVMNKVGEGDTNNEELSINISQSGKMKKKVSFRLPVVADIFIMDLADVRYEK